MTRFTKIHGIKLALGALLLALLAVLPNTVPPPVGV
jgi:hypothetical protein